MAATGVTDMAWSATLPGNRIERTRHRGDGNRVLHQHLTTTGVAL